MKVHQALIAAQEAGRPCAMVLIIGVNGSTPRSGGARMLVFPDGEIVGTVGGGELEHRLIAQAIEAIREGRPRRFAAHLTRDLGMCCGGAMEAWIEPFRPVEDLVIFGAGHVGAVVAAVAAPLGFRVTVVDARDDLLVAARFPAEVRLSLGEPMGLLDQLPLGPRSYALIVTHAHALDQDLVEALLPRPLAWLGMIGSRAKVARFSLRLRAGGLDPALLERLAAPVGLDIGAETPEEIAISIAAELVRVRRGITRPPTLLATAGRAAGSA